MCVFVCSLSALACLPCLVHCWPARHQILFNKDNHHYHPNFRDYFNRLLRMSPATQRRARDLGCVDERASGCYVPQA